MTGPGRTLSSRSRSAVAWLVAIALISAVVPAGAQESLVLEGYQRSALESSELGQGVVIIVFWASWSPRCRNIVERTDAIVERWGDRARVLLVDFQEEPAKVGRFLGDKKPRAPIYLDRDGAFSKKHAVTHLPGLLIFKDGVTGFSGKLPNDPHPLIGQTIG